MGYIVLEKPRPLPPLKLGSVLPLLEYLQSLSHESADRALSWAEDTMACEILVGLELPDATRELEDLILYYARPEYYESRTLCVWYGIAKTVARCVQNGL